ncbi:hypothetical protein BDP55DRAFT_738603 [Colletotrichum godetiae]|uniref:Nephrocystin 3-like N-terminal domain-containing protein n=1 Tax=Colletotrichum godetiae TaxID=1209918 RepID=A0AAJ0A5K5_9PEZI|nr:uncharacterized protein BDP55DRAFT_738603 [Colletotrichum godetiae]KAK1656916.1 hypothetical protein BDP55DRAFT_738603 [Colletotrichum godetiae]
MQDTGRGPKNDCSTESNRRSKVLTSKWDSFVSALKNERFSGDKEELRVRLEACRGQLHFKLNYVTSRDTQDKLKDIIDLSTSSNTRLEDLQASVEQIRSSIQAPGLDEAIKGSLNSLLDIPEDKLDAVAQERVLNGLKFVEMNHRFDQVSEAHAETFKWMFSDEEDEKDFSIEEEKEQHDEGRRETRRRFLDWLSTGSGVFRFSAKLGAGESTLMELIINNPHVQDKLQQWAGDSRQLVLATHFFWQPGNSYLQKSFDGMCRALLYGAIVGRPELTRLLSLSHWNSAWSAPWKASKELIIHHTEVREALKLLVYHTKVNGSFRFCFFIDGLDEMEESTDFQHRHLAETLKEWSRHSSANIKFCVSSREYNIFLHISRKSRGSVCTT